MSERRFPSAVYSRGGEPDARFTLANERTFLAWIRTALALIAGGVALELLGLDLHPAWRLAASLLLIATGIVLPALAWLSWTMTEAAIRLDRSLPGSGLGALLGTAVTLSGILVIISVLLR